MTSMFHKIRTSTGEMTIRKKLINLISIFMLGLFLGSFSKYLDCSQGNLPLILDIVDRTLDFHNFLGRFSLWIFIGVCLSVYSRTPFRAAVHVFVFFTGFVASYFAYSAFIGGFFPKSYALIWGVFTIAAPFLAYICWYSRGDTKLAFVISMVILSVFINTTFAYGWIYFFLRYVPELVVLFLAITVLRRTAREMLFMIGGAILLAPFLKHFFPFIY